jgi:hypothetical protein
MDGIGLAAPTMSITGTAPNLMVVAAVAQHASYTIEHAVLFEIHHVGSGI